MKKTFTEEEVIRIISLVQAIKDGKKVETPNGKGGYVEVKDITINDLLQYFNKYRVSSNTSSSKYRIDLTNDEIDMIKTSVRCMLSAKMNDKAQKICRNILDGLKEIKPTKNIKTVIEQVNEAINSSPCCDCIDSDDEIDCSKCPYNDELTNEELLSRIAENNSKKNEYNINPTINEEESNMIQNTNNVTQEPKFTVTNITYGDTLSENIKSVIRSDMTEDEKVSVIIGLFSQRTNYIEYPWNYPQTIYQTTAENKNESKTM